MTAEDRMEVTTFWVFVALFLSECASLAILAGWMA